MAGTENLQLEGEYLQKFFNEAANAVQAYATGMLTSDSKPSDAQLLELYGLYKVATIGACHEPQPGMLQMRARSKWQAWKNKSSLSARDAMEEYVKQVMTIYNWVPPTLTELGSVSAGSHGSGFAVSVSRPHVPEEENFADINTPFGWVKDNDINKIKSWIREGKGDINLSDEEGLTLLHWAVDRGRKEVCEILLNAGADPELKDEDDQTPLDYAITCEHKDIINLLQSHIKDSVSA